MNPRNRGEHPNTEANTRTPERAPGTRANTRTPGRREIAGFSANPPATAIRLKRLEPPAIRCWGRRHKHKVAHAPLKVIFSLKQCEQVYVYVFFFWLNLPLVESNNNASPRRLKLLERTLQCSLQLLHLTVEKHANGREYNLRQTLLRFALPKRFQLLENTGQLAGRGVRSFLFLPPQHGLCYPFRKNRLHTLECPKRSFRLRLGCV